MHANHDTTTGQSGDHSPRAAAPPTRTFDWHEYDRPYPTARVTYHALFRETPRGLALQHLRWTTVTQRGDTAGEIDTDPSVDDLPPWLQARLEGQLASDTSPIALTDGGQPRDGGDPQ